MMQNIKTWFCLIALASLAAGCHLRDAPDCVMGQQRCESDNVLSSGIAYVCLENNTWQGMACPAGCADMTECAGGIHLPACDVEGDRICETMESMSISFICVNKQWIPTVCATGAVCEGDRCSKSHTSCEEGAQLCIDVDAIGASIASVCKNGEWISSYCQEGLGCDGEVCATEERVQACGNSAVDCTQTVDGWADGSCQAGKCEASSCKSGYHLYDKSCEKNDHTHCGSHESVCEPSSLPNSKTVECTTEGQCIATDCDTGYHLYDNACEMNDNTHCGSHESVCESSSLPNSKTVECTTEGQCIATDCDTGYHPYNNACEKDELINCGAHDMGCTVDSVTNASTVDCVEGKCVATGCETGDLCDGKCVDLLSDKGYCGSCNTACNATDFCADGECMQPSCEDGQNIYVTRSALKPKSDAEAEPVEVKAFCINSPELLYKVRDAINKGKVYPESNTDNAYILTADLTLDAASWVPIGLAESGFNGVFLGNQKTIHLDNEEITAANDTLYEAYGFFGGLVNAYVDGIILYIKMNLKVNAAYAGGLAASAISSIISHSTIYPTIIISSPGSKHMVRYFVGGLAGGMDLTSVTDVKVLNAEISFNDNPGDYVGGLIGTEGGNWIDNCEFNGNISGGICSGGLIGHGSPNMIKNCKTSGNITKAATVGSIVPIAGGVIGNLIVTSDNEQALISNTYSSMNIKTGLGICGGLIGYNSFSEGSFVYKISDSYATGDVECPNSGGFIGKNEGGTIENCYATGNVNGSSEAGGFVGIDTLGHYISCGYFGHVEGKTSNIGLFAGSLSGSDNATFNVDKCFAISTVPGTATSFGGFAGTVTNEAESPAVINHSYSLSPADSFINGATGKFSISNSYYKNNSDTPIGKMSGAEITPLNLSDVVIKQNGEDVLTVYDSDGTTPLQTALGEGWTSKTCMLDIGDGAKQYVVPLSTTIYPAICQ